MQTDSYKTYPKFGSFPVSNTPAGTKIADANGFFDQLMTLVAKNAASPELAHIGQAALINAWGTVGYVLSAKPVTNA